MSRRQSSQPGQREEFIGLGVDVRPLKGSAVMLRVIESRGVRLVRVPAGSAFACARGAATLLRFDGEVFGERGTSSGTNSGSTASLGGAALGSSAAESSCWLQLKEVTFLEGFLRSRRDPQVMRAQMVMMQLLASLPPREFPVESPSDRSSPDTASNSHVSKRSPSLGSEKLISEVMEDASSPRKASPLDSYKRGSYGWIDPRDELSDLFKMSLMHLDYLEKLTTLEHREDELLIDKKLFRGLFAGCAALQFVAKALLHEGIWAHTPLCSICHEHITQEQLLWCSDGGSSLRNSRPHLGGISRGNSKRPRMNFSGIDGQGGQYTGAGFASSQGDWCCPKHFHPDYLSGCSQARYFGGIESSKGSENSHKDRSRGSHVSQDGIGGCTLKCRQVGAEESCLGGDVSQRETKVNSNLSRASESIRESFSRDRARSTKLGGSFLLQAQDRQVIDQLSQMRNFRHFESYCAREVILPFLKNQLRPSTHLGGEQAAWGQERPHPEDSAIEGDLSSAIDPLLGSSIKPIENYIKSLTRITFSIFKNSFH